jgi:hypothetical protein
MTKFLIYLKINENNSVTWKVQVCQKCQASNLPLFSISAIKKNVSLSPCHDYDCRQGKGRCGR